MKRSLNLAILGIDHGHIFDMLDEMIKEGCNCNYFWTEGSPLTLKEFNKKYPNIKRVENKSDDRRIGFVIQSYISTNVKQVLGKNGVQLARGKDDYNFHETIGRPKSLMDKNDLKIKKKENDNLQEIFYKGSSKKGNY